MLFLGDLCNRTPEIAQFKPLSLLRRAGQQRLVVTQSDPSSLTHGAAHMIDILVVKDRKQPGVQIGAPLPEVELRQSAGQAVLNEIVGEYASRVSARA
jgi:hypothetical protein